MECGGYLVFKLAGTFEEEPTFEDNTLLQEEVQNDKHIFRFTKKRKAEDGVNVPHDDPEVSQSLTEMVQSYLELDTSKTQSPKTSKRPIILSPSTTSDIELEDYVYDIYYRERYTDKIEGLGNIGFM